MGLRTNYRNINKPIIKRNVCTKSNIIFNSGAPWYVQLIVGILTSFAMARLSISNPVPAVKAIDSNQMLFLQAWAKLLINSYSYTQKFLYVVGPFR